MTAIHATADTTYGRLSHDEKMSAVARVASGITRDIGEAVDAAGTSVLQLLADLAPSHPAYEQLDDVRESMQRIASVTRQLGAFTRTVSSGRPTDINRAVERTRPLLERLAGPGVAVGYHPCDRTVWTHVDDAVIEQTLFHLVVNARDAMPDGGSIALSTMHDVVTAPRLHRHGVLQPGEWATIEVRDSGSGMPVDVVDRIFEPFFTTKGPGFGNGLGLSTVYALMRQGGGQVMVESEPGEGTAVRLVMPAMPREETRALSGDDRVDTAVLVVDDDGWVRTVAGRILKRAGYGVLEAENGTAALELLRGVAGSCVKLVLSDVMMPGISGINLAGTIHREFPDTPVLLMTGLPGGHVASNGSANSVGPVLSKPFTQTELLNAVRVALQ